MSLFKKEIKAAVDSRYSVRVMAKDLNEVINLLRSDSYKKHDIQIVDTVGTTLELNGEKVELVGVLFESSDEEYIDIRCDLKDKGLEVLKEAKKVEAEKK